MEILNINNIVFLILIIIIGYYSLKYLFFVLIGLILGIYLTYLFYKQSAPHK